MNNSHTCPVCGEGTLQLEETSVTLNLNAKEISSLQHFHWCDACGMELALPDDTKFNARMARRAELESLGRLSGDAIYSLRKELSLTQENAGKIFGGGPIAFCKYEKHDLAPSEPMDNLLWLIRKFPALALHLAERHGIDVQSTKSEFCLNEGVCFETSEFEHEQGRELFATVSSAIANSHRSWAHGSFWSNASREAANQNSITIEAAFA